MEILKIGDSSCVRYSTIVACVKLASVPALLQAPRFGL